MRNPTVRYLSIGLGSRFQVIVKKIQVDNVLGVASTPPKFGCCKSDGVTVLGLVSQSMRHDHPNWIHSEIDIHPAPTPSDVSRPSGVASRNHTYNYHIFAYLVFGHNIHLHAI